MLIITPREFCPHGTTAPSGIDPPHYQVFTITFGHTKFGRNTLDE